MDIKNKLSLLDQMRKNREEAAEANVLNKKTPYEEMLDNIEFRKKQRTEKPFYELEPASENPIEDINNLIEEKKVASFTPDLNLDNSKRLASAYNEDYSIPSQESPVIEQAPQKQSFSQSIKNIIKTKSPVSAPIASKASREEGMGEAQQTPDVYKDAEMEAALAEARQNRARQLYAQAGRQFAEGLGGLGAGQQVKLDTSLEDTLEKSTENPVTDLTNLRKGNLQKLQLQEEAEKSDPNSAVSIAMRNTLAEMGVTLPKNANYATMEKLAPQIMRNKEFQMRMQEMAMRQEELRQNKELTKNLAGSEKVMKMVDEYGKTDDVKMFKATTVAKDAVNAAINAKDDKTRRGLLGPAFMLFAKIAQGDPSVVRESDIKMLTTNIGINPDIFGKIEAYAKGEKGISNTDLKNMQTILSLVEQNKAEDIQGQYDLIKKRRDVLAKDAISDQELFNPSVVKHLERVKSEANKKASGITHTVDADAKKYAEMHNLSYEQAKAILDKRKGVK